MILTAIIAAIVTSTASDGVNKVATDLETGVSAATTVGSVPDGFREGSPQTVLISGSDGRYVVMSEAWYADLTNRISVTENVISIIRADAEKTETGRVKFHGKRVRVSDNIEALERIHFYEDGWSFSEKFQKRESTSPSGLPPVSSAKPKSVGSDTRVSNTPRFEEVRRRRDAAKKPVQYTEIHIGGK